jgi:serine/threonine protein kinase/TPR repeat protein
MPERATFDHYEVPRRDDGSLWELGRGAMGTTYKAFDTNLRCFVALKVINAAYLQSEVARQRFVREARSAAQLRHGNVASVFHLGIEGDSYFYAMEFIDGETVESLIKRTGPLDPILALRIASQVARALGAAERLHLVHRDIKPANLMLVQQDDELVVKVIDFGLAKSSRAEDGDDTAAISMGGFVGTPHFASPEQLEEKDLDVRSDIYSLGATLWYMLAGRAPFSGTLAQVMSQHLQRPPPFDDFDAWPQPVTALLRHMLEKDAAKRPQTAVALRAEIDRAIEALKAQGEQEFPTVIETPAAKAPTLQVGATIAGRYQIVADLGETNAGRVFRASLRGDDVRLLVLRPETSRDALTQIEREVEKLAGIGHPNLLRVPALETADGNSFLVLEWTQGFSLTELLRVRRELPADEVLPVLKQLAAGADHAITHGLKRLDLALHQVVLHFPGVPDEVEREKLPGQPLGAWPEFFVKINPLGVARDLATSETWAGGQTLVEGLAAAAQSVAATGLAARYVQSLGAIVYELLGGTLSPVLAGAGHGQPAPRYVPLANLSEEGNEALKRAMDPTRSFASAGEFFTALQSPMASVVRTPAAPPATVAPRTSAPTRASAVAVPPPVPAMATERPRMSPFAKAAVALMALLLLGVGGAYVVISRLAAVLPHKQQETQQETPATSPAATPSQAAAATPKPAPAFSPTPAPTPDRGEELRKAIAEAEAAENARDWKKAIQAYLRVGDDFPESDTGKVRLEMTLTHLRSAGEQFTPAQFDEIRDLLDEAGRRDSVSAMMLLAENLRLREPQTAFNWFCAAADRGHAPAFTQVGLMYSNGAGGVARDLKKAVWWFQEAATRGDTPGITCLAECHLGGKGVAKDEPKAIGLLNDAIAAGDLRAMNLLGTCYHQGVGVAKNYGEAFRLFNQAQEQGYADALGNLAVLHMNGEGVERDPRKAVELFQRGAVKGSGFCMFQYARCVEAGIGVAQNRLEAETWYRRAAELGNPRALEWCRKNGVAVRMR